MTEAEFRAWRRPARQREMFPKAWEYRREHERALMSFTCCVCGQTRALRDVDAFLEDTCIGCVPTLF